jgi:c-di-GMP-related signal transduction protein
MLMSDVVEILPPDRVFLEILETVEINQDLVNRVSELKERGFKLALDDIIYASAHLQVLRGLIDIIKLDLKQIPPDALPALVARFKSWPVRLLAEKVEDHQQVQQCIELGIDMFQGYYFARPQILSGRRLDPSKAGLVRLFSLVLSDATDQAIEEELKRHAKLTFNLMRMVNSAAYASGKQVTSMKQCVVLLGRRQLQRWVQILLYASPQGDIKGNPLLHTAAVRARLMERLAETLEGAERGQRDRAFMVGILSLLDVLLGIPMAEIINELPLEQSVKDALTSHSGLEGKLLSLIISKEANDIAGVEFILQQLPGISLSRLAQEDMAAVAWCDRLVASS